MLLLSYCFSFPTFKEIDFCIYPSYLFRICIFHLNFFLVATFTHILHSIFNMLCTGLNCSLSKIHQWRTSKCVLFVIKVFENVFKGKILRLDQPVLRWALNPRKNVLRQSSRKHGDTAEKAT